MLPLNQNDSVLDYWIGCLAVAVHSGIPAQVDPAAGTLLYRDILSEARWLTSLFRTVHSLAV